MLDGLGDEGTVVRFVARELTGDDTSAEFLLKSTVETIRFDAFSFCRITGPRTCFASSRCWPVRTSVSRACETLRRGACRRSTVVEGLRREPAAADRRRRHRPHRRPTPRFYGIGRAVLVCRVLIGGHAFLLGGRTFDERCDDLEGALVRWGAAAAARLRRSWLFGAASSPARLLLRGAACAVAAANIIRGLPDGGGVLRMAYEFAEGTLCSYCFWRGYRFGVKTLGYLWLGRVVLARLGHGFAPCVGRSGQDVETSEGSQWSANVQMVGVLVLIFKALSWFWFVGPYEAVQKFAAAMAAAALWTTTAVEYVATAVDRYRERKAARAQARQAEAATQELLSEEQRRSEARRARAEAAAAEARAARVEWNRSRSRNRSLARGGGGGPNRRLRPPRRRRARLDAAACSRARLDAAAAAAPRLRPPRRRRRRRGARACTLEYQGGAEAPPRGRERPAPAPAPNRKARRAAAAAARAAAPAVTVDVPAVDPGAAAILRRLGLERLEPTFAREMIDAETLPLLAAGDLTDVGVPAGDAARIVEAMQPAATESHPENLSCPISMELMREPVLAADGFTYDRHAISAWLARGKTTSPTTGAPLAHTHLTPNHLVKSMPMERPSSSRGAAAAGGGNLAFSVGKTRYHGRSSCPWHGPCGGCR